MTSKEYYVKYYQEHKKERKEYDVKYYQEHKEKIKIRKVKYYQEHKKERKESDAKYYQDNKKRRKIQMAKYRNSLPGKIASIRAEAKRRRNFGYEILFDNIFPKSIKTVGHHISNGFVFNIPESIHLQHLGNNHREQLKPIVEQLYNISYTIVDEVDSLESDINKDKQIESVRKNGNICKNQ